MRLSTMWWWLIPFAVACAGPDNDDDDDDEDAYASNAGGNSSGGWSGGGSGAGGGIGGGSDDVGGNGATSGGNGGATGGSGDGANTGGTSAGETGDGETDDGDTDDGGTDDGDTDDGDTDDTGIAVIDMDGDGYPAHIDCDDDDDTIHSPSSWYIDYDDDGFGVPAFTLTACTAPLGYVDNDTDCDDTNADIHPAAFETCNEADDDCDGERDEGVTNIYFEDADGDGYGHSSSTTEACERPDGYAENSDDCDDSLVEVSPSAEEICDDGLDNDCDGLAGDCRLAASSADVVLWGVSRADSAGISVSGGGDLNGDGYSDIVVGARNESTVGAETGAAYVIYGRTDEEFTAATADTDGVMSLADADVILTGELDGDKAGRQVAVIPDVSGDGLADLVVSSPSADPLGDAAGTVYVMFGGGTSGSLADADLIIDGVTGFNYTGLGLGGGNLTRAGDSSDILIGAPGNDVGGDNTGAIWIVEGPVEADATDVSELATYVTGQSVGDSIGKSFDTLDVNGDGQDDLLVGASDSSEGGTKAGIVHVVFGPIAGAVSLADADIQYTGESAGDELGVSVSSAGDTNDDGYDDFIAGAQYDDESGPDAGAAYVLMGGAIRDAGRVDDFVVTKFVGESGGDQFGQAVTGGGNIGGTDAEEYLDFIVTAPLAGEGVSIGSVYVFYGSVEGTVLAEDADARIDGELAEDMAGSTVRFVGDVDGSGHDAFLVGTPYKDTTAEDAGGAYLMFDIGL